MSKILGISAFYHDSAACLLNDGKIIASGSPQEIINDTQARTVYFGDEFKIN